MKLHPLFLPCLSPFGRRVTRLVSHFLSRCYVSVAEGDMCSDIAYPPPDVAVRDFLFSAASKALSEAKAHIAALFVALFRTAATYINTRLPRPDHYTSDEALAYAWKEYLEMDGQRIRRTMYGEVIEVRHYFVSSHCVLLTTSGAFPGCERIAGTAQSFLQQVLAGDDCRWFLCGSQPHRRYEPEVVPRGCGRQLVTGLSLCGRSTHTHRQIYYGQP